MCRRVEVYTRARISASKHASSCPLYFTVELITLYEQMYPLVYEYGRSNSDKNFLYI